jgi:uncharacterized protein YqgC (DUF456 family)
MTHTIIEIIFILLLIPGIILAIIPNIPGMIYMLLIAICFSIYDQFVHVTGTDLAILSGIVAVVMLVDFFSGVAGAKWGGAHWSSILSGLIGLVFGSVLIPLPIIGSLIGMFIAILATEWHRTRNIRQANKAAMGSLAGTLIGTVIKAAGAIIFVGLCIYYLVR